MPGIKLQLSSREPQPQGALGSKWFLEGVKESKLGALVSTYSIPGCWEENKQFFGFLPPPLVPKRDRLVFYVY